MQFATVISVGTLLLVTTLPCMKIEAQMFTGLLQLQNALQAERIVSEELRQYITDERHRISALEKLVEKYERSSLEALADPERHLANPVNAYLVIKRLTIDFKQVNKYLGGTKHEEFQEILYNKTEEFLPNHSDMVGAATALLRLQDTYELSTDKIASGDISETKSSPMNADDCLQLGIVAFNDDDWYHAHLWMSKALELDDVETSKTAVRVKILEYLSVCTFMQDNIQHAYNLTLEWLQIEPDQERAMGYLQEYRSLIAAESKHDELLNRTVDTIKNVPIPKGWRNHQSFDLYQKLCRGEKTEVIDERHLTCQYRQHHPMFYINPLREEVLHLKPRIVVYHNIINDEEIEKMIELTKPKLKRSVLVKKRSGEEQQSSEVRTSQSGWIYDKEHPMIHRLSQRTMAMVNLTLNTTEPYQVLNYGIGGHYEPHYDFTLAQEEQISEEFGNRVATVLFYMSDVEAGGRTVFNLLGVGAAPEKGSCLVWFNLLKNGEGDFDTRHAGCPVLLGTKWIANKWFHIRGQEFTRPCALSEDE